MRKIVFLIVAVLKLCSCDLTEKRKKSSHLDQSRGKFYWKSVLRKYNFWWNECQKFFATNVTVEVTRNLLFIISASWLKTCQFKDPEFFKCSTVSVQGLFDNLVKGIEGIEGLDSIDPMRIDRIRILQGEGPVSVNASLTKVKVTGFSKVKVSENQVNSKDFGWITTVNLPKMRLEGNYHMMGRILVIPLNVSFASFR